MDAGAFTVAPGAGAAPRSAGPRWPSAAASVLLWSTVLLALTVAAGAALGVRTAVVLTGSMEPALSPGDMIVTQRVPAAEARTGDIISFASPREAGVVITHRVRKIGAGRDGRIAFVTQGDANNTPERWTIARDGTVGRVRGVLPGAGALTGWTGDPALRLLIFGLLGAGLLLVGLRWIWRRP